MSEENKNNLSGQEENKTEQAPKVIPSSSGEQEVVPSLKEPKVGEKPLIPSKATVSSNQNPPVGSEPPIKPEKKKLTKKDKVLISVAGGIVFLMLLFGIVLGRNSILSRGINPEHLQINDLTFAQEGRFGITGIGNLSEEKITELLSFSPEVDFVVSRVSNDRVDVRIINHRNIGYEVFLKRNSRDEEPVSFVLNSPKLTIKLSGERITYEYQSINLIANEQVDIDSLRENMTIVDNKGKSVEYYLDYDVEWVSITPSQESPWRANRYYITINENYTSTSGKQLSEEVNFNFVTALEKSQYALIRTRQQDSYVINVDRTLELTFAAGKIEKPVPVRVTAYKFKDLDTFKDVYKDLLDTETFYFSDKNKKTNYKEIRTEEFSIHEGDNIISLEHEGPGGYALVTEYTDPGTEEVVQSCVSYFVTPLTVYMQATNRDTMFWLNNTQTGGPIEGYTVKVEENMDNRLDKEIEYPKLPFKMEGKTDKDGLLMLEQKTDYTLYSPHFSIYDEKGDLVYFDTTAMYLNESKYEHYYSYFYLDRAIYKPKDTIHFWGFVQAHKDVAAPSVTEVDIIFDPGGLDLAVKAPVNEAGIYTGQIELESIKSQEYRISSSFVVAGEEDEEGNPVTRHLDSQYISVKEFEKPKYVLESEVDKKVYGMNDIVEVIANAKFYDGTPLPEYPVEAAYYNSSTGEWTQIPDVVTDEFGVARFSFPAYNEEENSRVYNLFTSGSYRVSIHNDGEAINHGGSYNYFCGDKLMEMEFEKQSDGKNVQLTARVFELNLQSEALLKEIEERPYLYFYDEELLELAKGKPVDTNLEMDLSWMYYDKTKVRHENRHSSKGEVYYDYQNSYSTDVDVRVVPNVKEDWNNSIKMINVDTKDGVAVIKDVIYLPEGRNVNFDEYFYCSVEARIRQGKAKAFMIGYKYYYGDRGEFSWEELDAEPIKGFSFQVTNAATGADVTPKTSYYRYIELEMNQPHQFKVLLDGEPVTSDGRILYSIIDTKTREHNLIDGDTFDFTFRREHGREVMLSAVYFNGRETFPIKTVQLDTPNDEFMLEVAVTPDKTNYTPGDTVKLNVTSKDKHGNPVAANLLISVVDESIFALREQYIAVLSSLYAGQYQLQSGVQRYFTSMRGIPETTDYWDAGKGGGGDLAFYDSYRKNFKDTAAFIPTTTNASGTALVEFELPDNTTSWRITALGIGNTLVAGSEKSNIISTLPYFTQPILTSKYIEGDDIALLVQGHGILLDKDSEIDYTVTLKGDNVDITLTEKGRAFQQREFNFGKLPIGSYTLIARSQFSGYSDTVELPLHVLKSNLELVVNKPIDITKEIDITAVRYPVTINIYNKTHHPFFLTLDSMMGHYCMAVNQRMSRYVAKDVIARNLGEEYKLPYYLQAEDLTIAEMQNVDGGIYAYPGSESEILVTNYLTQFAADEFNKRQLESYFLVSMEQTEDPKELAACYFGLAALDKMNKAMIMTQIKETLKEKEVRKDVLAYYVGALARIGEEKEALDLYKKHLAGVVKNIDKASSWSYDALEYRDGAATWMAATLLKLDDADTYASAYAQGWRYRTLFESMLYVMKYDKPIEPETFTYTINGEATTVDLRLDRKFSHSLVLNESELSTLKFSNVSDGMQATAYYVGEPSEIGMNESKEVTIFKGIKRDKDPDTYIIELRMKFSPDAPSGQYDISDWIPSNSRLYEQDYHGWDLHAKQEGQKMYITYYHSQGSKEKEVVFSYKIRQTFEGEAVLDTAYIIHGESGINAHTEKRVFSPREIEGRESTKVEDEKTE